MQVESRQPVSRLVSRLASGHIDRRAFVQQGLALGVGFSVLVALADRVSAQSATPQASPAAGPSAVGTEDQTRGEGGELKIIQYQAPTSLATHTAAGYSNFSASQLVLEPLLCFLPDATLWPVLATEVPSFDNGLLREDGTGVTFKLREGVTWSDGTPFTAEDIRFTVEWVQNADNAATTRATYEMIAEVTVVDDLTAEITFTEPSPFWFEPFTGFVSGVIYPKHILEAGKDAYDAFSTAPIGTGPYVVDKFTPNDQILYSINESYREPNKPYFSTVTLKGGGDAAAAARAVAQTGEFDFAWGPQVEPDVLASIVTPDSLGQFVPIDPVNVERMAFNFADPHAEVDGQRAEVNTPNPVLSDPAVREAIFLAVNRETIATRFYDTGSDVAINVINGDPATTSTAFSYTHDPDAAAAKLDEAGWVMDGSTRAKDGVPLKLTLSTAATSRRQKAQAVVKSDLEAIGFEIALEQVDSGIFFDTGAGNDQNYVKFYWDMEIYIQPQTSTRPLKYMEQWYAGKDNANIPQKANNWSGSNNARWVNEEYDALFEETSKELDPDALAANFIRLNDLVIGNSVVLPLVVVGTESIASKDLVMENLISSSFAGSYWNIANWRFA